jgi:imidazolonepropionase-like amidohydrolase
MNRLIQTLVFLALTPAAFAATTVIVGGKVHTVGPQGTLENATVLIEDGRIAAVGAKVELPAGATVIDATGKIVTPGLFSPYGQLGLVEVGLSAGPTDYAQRGTDFTAGFDVADAYNKRSTLIAINRSEGITRAVITPTPGWAWPAGAVPGHVISGLGAIVNLGDDDVIDRRGAVMTVVLGEAGASLAGGTRTAAWLTLRNALDEALDYRAHKGDFERGMRREYRHSIADLEALQGVINGNTPMLVHIDRASDIEVLIDFVGEYGLAAIIAGGAEAWMLADELAAADIAVIISTTHNLPGSFDHINARRGAANILLAAGVKVTFSESESETHNARNITQAAGNAVADGLDWDAALRAITLTPAEIFGIAGITGSIETGKAADIVIWPGDPLELTNYPEKVFINGVAVPMENRQTLLRDRYLQLESELPPAYRD